MATNGVAVGVEVGIAGFAAASFAFKVQTRAAATQSALQCWQKHVAQAPVAAALLVVVAESCRRFVEERGRRRVSTDCGSLHDNAPCRICMRAATT